MKIVFFGAGYCCRYIIPNLEDKSEIICTHNLKTKPDKYDQVLQIRRLSFRDFFNNKENLLKNVTHILNSIPPLENGDVVYEMLNSIDDKILSELVWFGYFSSTSVYGNHDGKWVDEETKTSPTNIRGERRLKVENLYMELFKKKKLPTHVFRLPGIYGPGRSVLDRILNGNNSVIRLKNHFFSRVHVEDIASAINKSMTIRTPGQIYNLTDNFPCSAHDVHEYASKLLKTQLPRYLDISSSNLNERVKDFYKDNKRVSNQKIKKILDWTPKFENYKLGLNNIFESLNG